MAWVNSLPSCPRGSHLIVAGDVSHSLAVVERTLRVLQSKFDEVFYTVIDIYSTEFLAQVTFA